jgi:hypothetical protein
MLSNYIVITRYKSTLISLVLSNDRVCWMCLMHHTLSCLYSPPLCYLCPHSVLSTTACCSNVLSEHLALIIGCQGVIARRCFLEMRSLRGDWELLSVKFTGRIWAAYILSMCIWYHFSPFYISICIGGVDERMRYTFLVNWGGFPTETWLKPLHLRFSVQ